MKRLSQTLICAAATAILAACPEPQPEEPVEIETVDVEPAIDAGLSTEDDLKAVRRPPEIVGVLPGGVPPDLPLYVPASVVDFGDLDGGRAWVELDAPAPRDRVRAWLGERLPAAGWTVGAIGGERLTVRKGGREAAYRLAELGSGTRIRLEYRPQ